MGARSDAKVRIAVFGFLHARALSIAPNHRGYNHKIQSMDLQTKKPANSWCCTASINQKKPLVQSVLGDADGSENTPFRGVPCYDVTTSPDWMEWIELTEDRSNDEGGAGAYDTLRCDLIVKEPKGEETGKGRLPRYTIWGEDYHLQRLVNSFSSLLDETRDNLPENAIQDAINESHALLQAMIREAQSSPFLKESSLAAPGEIEDEDHTWIQLLKLTLLWSLDKESKSSSSSSFIVVRGHACSSATPIPVFRSAQPIVVTLAALGHKDEVGGSPQLAVSESSMDAQVDSSLPSRFQDPQSKVASWCKQRKKMDNPETYKPPGVSEVLMLRRTTTTTAAATDTSGRSGDLEILEGLSSNAFVIYKDGTIRTAKDGVLHGYVRHLVLQSAEKCGLEVDTTQPICLQDAIDGKWKECFVTSSSRLIWPVSRILLPSSVAEACSVDSDKCEIDGFSEFWKDPSFEGLSLSTPQWLELLQDILHQHYKK